MAMASATVIWPNGRRQARLARLGLGCLQGLLHACRLRVSFLLLYWDP